MAIRSLGLLLPVFAALGCGVTEPTPPPVVVEIRIAPAAASLLIGATREFVVTPRDSYGNIVTGHPFTWATTAPTVATVSEAGLVTGVGAGIAMITATLEGHVARAEVTVVELSPTSVAPGYDHTCSLSASGAAVCWGNNAYGQMGGPTGEICQSDFYWDPYPCGKAPALVDGGVTFSLLTAGAGHTCGLTPEGQAYCWGQGGYGALGYGLFESRSAPNPVMGGLVFQSLASGAFHTCGLTAVGAAYCWGANASGQLGMSGDRAAPAAVDGGLSFVRLSLGDRHSCGITTAARLYCWGENNSGQLGDGSLAPRRPAPFAVVGNLEVASADPGDTHTCAVTTSGEGYCWGDNSHGQLGDGTTISSRAPVRVAGGTRWKTITAGTWWFTCGIDSNNLAHCWGDNTYGQLGTGSTVERWTPTPVAGGLGFGSLTAGGVHACGRTVSGALYCWGAGSSGQLGTGSTAERSVPSLVLGQR